VIVGRTLAVVAGAGRAFVAGPKLAAPVVARRQVVVSSVEALALRDSGWRRFRIGEVRMTIPIGREGQPHDRDRKESGHYDLTHRKSPLSAQPPSRERYFSTVAAPRPF